METTKSKRGRGAVPPSPGRHGAGRRSTMALGATGGHADAAGTCRYTVNGLTALDLQEGGNGRDEISDHT